jgi:hypothetical protein
MLNINNKQIKFTLEELTNEKFELVGSGQTTTRVCFHNDYLGKGYLMKVEGNYLVKLFEYDIPIRYDKR